MKAPEAMSDSNKDYPGDVAHVRRIPATDTDHPVTLVGVVHHHPASSHRVKWLVSAAAPDILALELPSRAVALARVRAQEPQSPPSDGSEMSAAIQAAGDASVVGIDAPSLGYCARLLSYCRRECVSLPVARDVVLDTAQSAFRALQWRVAASVESRLGLTVDTGRTDGHGVDNDQPVEALLQNESRHISVTRTFQNAVTQPVSVDIVDTVREQTMAARLRRLRGEGDVVAVVGLGHLDAVTDRLEQRTG